MLEAERRELITIINDIGSGIARLRLAIQQQQEYKAPRFAGSFTIRIYDQKSQATHNMLCEEDRRLYNMDIPNYFYNAISTYQTLNQQSLTNESYCRYLESHPEEGLRYANKLEQVVGTSQNNIASASHLVSLFGVVSALSKRLEEIFPRFKAILLAAQLQRAATSSSFPAASAVGALPQEEQQMSQMQRQIAVLVSENAEARKKISELERRLQRLEEEKRRQTNNLVEASRSSIRTNADWLLQCLSYAAVRGALFTQNPPMPRNARDVFREPRGANIQVLEDEPEDTQAPRSIVQKPGF